MVDDDLPRARIARALADGLQTQTTPRAYDSDEVNALCRHLQALAPGDLEARLVIAGFTLDPYVDPGDTDGIEQSCATCMYYERHRRYCALPELQLPVEPRWSCTLWRI